MERVGAGGQGFLQDAVTPDVFEADAARLGLDCARDQLAGPSR